MATRLLTYSLNDFDNIGSCVLPSHVLSSLNLLFESVGYTSTTTNTFINQFSVTVPTQSTNRGIGGGGGGGQKPRDVQNRVYKPKKPKEDEWKRPTFRATVFAELDNTQTLISDIRSELNKINDTNCLEKIITLMQKIDQIRELVDFGDDVEMDEKMSLVFTTIFSICISNKSFAKIYGTALIEINRKYDIRVLINTAIANYLQSMQNIIDVDSNIDYDAFCEFTTVNNNRKNITNLFCEIAKTDQFEGLRIRDIHTVISNLLNHVFVSVDSAEKQKEVEEITENIVIIFSHFKDEFKPEFKQQLELLASFKKPGLSSRTKFKYMDLIGK
jgi:hypothetical protein